MKQEDYDRIEKELQKPKSKKGLRILREREAKVVEGPKNTIFIKGNKGSEVVTEFLKDFYNLKRDHSVNYTNKHDIHPFDNMSQIEKFSNKNDCTLFVFGSHQKKRPNNIVFGRLFDGSLLDMVEFGVENFRSAHSFEHLKISIPAHSRPAIIFQGEVFETQESYIKIKNLLLDTFVENIHVENLDLISGLTHAIVVSGSENGINFKTFAIQMDAAIAKKENAKEDDKPLKITEVGPSCDFVIRREKWASADEYKKANKRPKVVAKKENKNVSYDNIGDKTGRVFVDKQNLHELALNKRKKLQKGEKALRKQEQKQKQQENNNKEVNARINDTVDI